MTLAARIALPFVDFADTAGARLTSVDMRLPFHIPATAAMPGILSVADDWSRPEIRRLSGHAGVA